MNIEKAQKAVCLALLLLFLLAAATSIAALALLVNKDVSVLPVLKASESEIYIIDGSVLSDDEYAMVVSLQGIVAQTESKIYIENSDNYVYVEGFVADHNIAVTEFSDPWELIDACRDCLADDGYVLFETAGSFTINTAATVSGVEKWLSVPKSAQDEAQLYGLVLKADMTAKNADGSYVHTYSSLFDRYKDVLNKNVIIHQSPDLVTLRDYGIATSAFCFYTDENSQQAFDFRQKVYSWANLNAPVLGWSTDELGYVEQASENGLFIIASDHSSNLSYLAGCNRDTPFRQKYEQRDITPDGSKHYVALIMSDGDNLQWCQNLPFTHHYIDRQNSAFDYRMTWTVPPLMAKLAPEALKYLYANANPNDSFISGVSGMGYINPTAYPRGYLKDFARKSVEAMGYAGLSTLAILDNSTSTFKLKRAMKTYADIDGLQGGFMQIADRYQSLNGKIVWCGDKPFISVRKSLWYSSDDGQPMSEWLQGVADEINSLPTDPTSENGYSYINIHPWSMTIADVDYFVSLLDEHIELVSAEELLQLVKTNVRH